MDLLQISLPHPTVREKVRFGANISCSPRTEYRDPRHRAWVAHGRAAIIRKRSKLIALVGGLALIAVAAASWLMLSRRGSKPSGALRIVPFSGLSGLERTPAFSPDGSQLAYSWNGGSGDKAHIYVKLIGAGAQLQLTRDMLSDCCPAWSPDGRTLPRFSSVFSSRERRR